MASSRPARSHSFSEQYYEEVNFNCPHFSDTEAKIFQRRACPRLRRERVRLDPKCAALLYPQHIEQALQSWGKKLFPIF